MAEVYIYIYIYHITSIPSLKGLYAPIRSVWLVWWANCSTALYSSRFLECLVSGISSLEKSTSTKLFTILDN